MKRRIRKVANFFAFNLLFFALYLNFIHKDKNQLGPIPQTAQQPAFSETNMAANQQATEQKEVTEKSSNTAALKLSIN